MSTPWGTPNLPVAVCALIALTTGCSLAPRPSMALRDLATHQPAYSRKISAGVTFQNLYSEFAAAPDLRFVYAPTDSTAWSMSFSTAAIVEKESASSRQGSRTSVTEPRHYTGRLLGRYEPTPFDRAAFVGGLGGGWTDNGAIFASADIGLVAVVWREEFIDYHFGMQGGISWLLSHGDPVVLARPTERLPSPYLPVSGTRLGPTFGLAANLGETGRLAMEFIVQSEHSFDGEREGGSFGADLSLSFGF